MSGGGSQQVGAQTQSNTPPAYMFTPIGTALQGAESNYQTPAQYFPGQTVAGFSKPQQQAMSGIFNMGVNGDPSLTAAQGFDQTLLQSGGGSNPYEDAMFHQMAGQTQNQLSGEFAGMGRNASASEPLRAEQLNNLATGFYGGQYQNNIQNALQAGNQAQSLYGTRMAGLNSAEGVGQQVSDKAQQEINANMARYNYYQGLPQQSLMQFIQALGGLQPGSMQSQPLYGNPAATGLGEASTLAGILKTLGYVGG